MSDSPPLDPAALLAQRPWVEELARGLVRDSSLAEDLAQEAWLRASRKGPREAGALRGFLAGVVQNLGRSARREAGRRARREQAAARPEALPSSTELVERAELQRLLVESVLALDEHERTAILLRYFEGLTAEEIARRSSVPAGTVRSRLQRGLEKLRVRLEARVERQDLFAGLLALARLPAPAPVGPVRHNLEPASSLPWIGGLLAMKSLLALAAGCAALLSFALGLWSSSDEADTRSRTRVPEAELASVELTTPATPELERATPEEAARSAVAAPAVLPTPAAPAAVLPARVHVRFVEPTGQPLAGVQVVAGETPVGASNAAGRIELELVPRGEGEVRLLTFSRPGFASTLRGARLVAGGLVHLGDVVLAPAAELRGRVVDEQGTPLGGVHLLATGVENPRTDREELRRLGPLDVEGAVHGESSADGSFALADVPLGPVRLWGGSESWAWSSLGPLEVRAEGLAELTLVLQPLRALDRIRGRVLAPDGTPVANAQLHTWFMAATYGSGGQASADEHGVFEILLQQRVAYDLTVSDPENRWSEIYAPAVEPGTDDLVLRFEPARWMEVTVKDPAGHDLAGAVFALESATAGNRLRMTAALEPLGTDKAGPGRPRLRVPTARFRVSVDVPAHEHAVQGPFEPEAAPAALAFELAALPGVRGVVLSSTGEPVSGAKVGLYATVGDKLVVEHDGFRLSTEAWTETKTTSGAQGEFVLYPPTVESGGYASGLFVLRAEAPGHAPTELGPRAFDPRKGEELELRLLVGGAIEGRAHGENVDATGLLLAFHRGDGKILTRRIGPDGHYRIEGLAPGPWEVRALEDEIHGQRSSSSASVHDEGAPPFEWSCTVRDGETTIHDVDLSDFAPSTLRGTLALSGRALADWSASLEVPGEDVVVASVPLDARGAFELTAPRAGSYRLVLRGPADASGRLELSEVLALEPGGRDWSLALAPGALRGSGALGRGTRERFYTYEWRGSVPGHALAASLRIFPAADGSFELATVPEGPGRISRNDPVDEGQDFAPWEVVAEFELAPGGVQGVHVP